MKIFLLLVTLSMYLTDISAQLTLDSKESDETMLVTMLNGEEYYGLIVSQDEESIVLKTKVAQITLKSKSVKSISPLNYSGKFFFPQKFYSKYFFGPNSIQLKKKEGYYQNTGLVLNSINYGITNNISIHAGAEFLFSILTGGPTFFISPKVGYQLTQETYVSGGLLSVKVQDQDLTLVGHGSITVGTKDSNVSFGAGYAFLNSQFRESPVLYIAGMQRIGQKFALLSENYILPIAASYNILMGIQGFRYFKNKNVFDIGAILIYDSNFSFLGTGLPYISYARVF